MANEHINKEILIDTPAATEKNITPRDLLRFAKVVLLVTAILFLIGGVSELIKPQNAFFEACKTVLPPLAALILGFYFAKSSN